MDRWCPRLPRRILGHSARVPTGAFTGATGETGCHRCPRLTHTEGVETMRTTHVWRAASRPLRGPDSADAHGSQRPGARHWSGRSGFESACRSDCAYRGRRGSRRRRVQELRVSRTALRGSADRKPALASPTASGWVGRRPRRYAVRPETIVESGAFALTQQPLPQAEAVGQAFAAWVCRASAPPRLRPNTRSTRHGPAT